MKNNQVCLGAAGVAVGVIAKLADIIPENIWVQYIGLHNLMNYFGVFVCIVCVIEYRSKNEKQGIINTFIFMNSMLVGYYVMHYLLYRYFPIKYIIFWMIIAVFSMLLCWIICLRRKKNIVLAVIGVMTPILLLSNEACRLIYVNDTHNVVLWINIIAVIVILIFLPQKGKVRALSLLSLIICFPLLFKVNFMTKTCNLLYALLFG